MMDEDRIERIARAMCRAARLDPDQPAGKIAPFTMMLQQPGKETRRPAWMLFVRQAELFVSTNRDIAPGFGGLAAILKASRSVVMTPLPAELGAVA